MIHRRNSVRHPSAPFSTQQIETLETRRMMSHVPPGPQIIAERLIGPSDAATAIQLQFSEPLDPATATDPKAYGFGILSSGSGGSGGSFFGPFFPFATRPGQVVRPHASLGGVSYDDSTHTVTLTAAQPFLATTFLRFIRVKGTGDHAVRDFQGVALNGHGHTGSDASIHFRFFRTKTFGFTDSQGDRVVLHLAGPGTIVAFLPRSANTNPIVFLENTTALSTTLTGVVHPSKRGSGIGMLQELAGMNAVKNLLPSNIQINFVQA